MIFVTGGTGFLGRNLLPLLTEQQHRVRVLSRNPTAHPWLQGLPNVDIVKGSLEDTALLQEALAGCNAVIHAGGLFRMWGSESDFYQTNVDGTRNLVHAALLHDITRFVYISTIAVIGNPTPGQIIDETHPPRPADAYQRSKLAGEAVIHDAVQDRDLNAVILRPGAFYGPHGRYAFNRLFFEDPLKGLLIKVDGGRRVIFPAYVKDVAQAACAALVQGQTGEIYNISGAPMTHNEVNAIVSEEAGITSRRINIPTWGMILFAQATTWLAAITHREPYYPIGLRTYVFNDWQTSNEKARAALGFTPTPFRDAARTTLDWYRDQHFHWARPRRN